MTTKDKELLLKDLSARLHCKPKIKVSSLWNENKEVEEDIVDSVYCVMPDGYINTETIDSDISLDDIVLYLRPMSSMTEEEISDLQKINSQFCFNKFDNFAYVGAADDGFCSVKEMDKILDYLNSKHFDYRGLIEKGLALEAPEGMYR